MQGLIRHVNGTKSDLAGIIAPPPLIYLGALALGLLLEWIWPTRLADWRGTLALGVAIALCGTVGVAWSFCAMRRGQTPVNPYKPTTAIVGDGPYHFSRNPIYLANAVIYIGLAVAINTLWPLLLLPALIAILHVGVIAREERYLEQKFGEDYLRYKRSIRRWL